MTNTRQDFFSCLRAHSQEHTHEQRSQEGSIKGGRAPPTQLHPARTIELCHRASECRQESSNVPLPSRTNCSTPWERNTKVTLVYLLSSLRSIIRQLTLLRTHSPCAPSLSPRSDRQRRCLWTSTSITGTRFTSSRGAPTSCPPYNRPARTKEKRCGDKRKKKEEKRQFPIHYADPQATAP